MAAIATVGAAFGDILLAAETKAPVAPSPTGHLNRHGIDEFSNFHEEPLLPVGGERC